jgi:hypothetical protein
MEGVKNNTKRAIGTIVMYVVQNARNLNPIFKTQNVREANLNSLAKVKRLFRMER